MVSGLVNALFGNPRRWLVAGIAATIVLALFMEGVARLAVGGPMKPAGLIQQVLALDPSLLWLAEILHYALGLIAFPIGFVVLRTLVPGPSSLLLGAVWGLVLWLAAGLAMAPLAGLPVFFGGGQMPVASLVAHLAYGLVLGAVYGRAPAAAVAA